MEQDEGQSLIGRGNRDWVVDRPTAEPYRFVCRIEAVIRNLPNGTYESALGSGFLVGPNTVVTAAHNVWQPGKGFYKQYNLGAGKFSPDNLGSMKQVLPKPDYIRVHPGFLKAKTAADLDKPEIRNWDIAVIALSRENTFTGVTGNFPAYGENVNDYPHGAHGGFGYPITDPKHMHGGEGSFSQRDPKFANIVIHDMPLGKGQSGCPILAKKPDGSFGNSCGAMHIGEFQDHNGRQYKFGLTFSDWLRRFISENAVIPN